MVTTLARARTAPYALGGDSLSVANESDIIAAVLDFANNVSTPSLAERIETFRISGSTEDYWIENADGDGEVISEDHAQIFAAREIEDERAFAVEMLTASAEGRTQLVQWLRRQVTSGRKTQIKSSPYLAFEKNRVRLNWQFVGPARSEGWVKFAAALLATSTEGEKVDIGRCNLDTCQRFFQVVIEGPGKPRRDYCCREHMLLAHQKDSPRRRRVAIQKRKAEAAKPRRRRSN